MEMVMVPILRPVQNKPVVFLILFLPQIILGNATLFCRGKIDVDMGISTGDLCDFDFVLNGRVSPEVLSQFSFADSIGAYYYKSENSDKLFNRIYFWFKRGRKRGRIKRISLSSIINSQTIHSEEDYKPEYVMRIINDIYGSFGMPNIRKFTFKRFNEAGEVYYLDRVYITWTIKNAEIEYNYLPYYNFNNRNLDTIGDKNFSYQLTLTLLN
jgi:hypothetical protein